MLTRFASSVAAVAVTATLFFASAAPAMAEPGASSGRKLQTKGAQAIPTCGKKLGTLSIVEPENQWWGPLGLGSPEAILKVFVQRSGCFGLVDRGRGMASRAVERALADSGELQAASNVGKGQVKAADYVLVPDIVSGNGNSGGMAAGAVLGGLGRAFGGSLLGGLAGGLNVKKKEANVTLAVVNTRTTEQEALTEGYARKTDIGFGAGTGGVFGGDTFGGTGGGGYQNTELGQVIVLAYLDAYTKLVTQLGGLPADAATAAPQAVGGSH